MPVGIGAFKEVNVFNVKDAKGVKIALVYPSTYQASITNLFMNIAYYFLNHKLPNALIDRFTLDNPKQGAISGKPLTQFDIALVSIGFELDLQAFAKMLADNGIPLLAKMRVGRNHPIFIGGGPPLMANPIPALVLMDYVYVGEGEPMLEKLVEIVEMLGTTPRREDIRKALNDMSPEEGIFVQGMDSVTRVHVRDLDNAYMPVTMIRSMTAQPVYGRGYYVEISRGCKWLCPFCMESFVFQPLRSRSFTLVKEKIIEGVNALNERRAVLYSLSYFDYPYSDELLEFLLSNNIEYSLPSIRYHTMTPERVELVYMGGQKTLTLAPETGSHKAACLIRKDLSEELLMTLSKKAIKLGMNLKFYFIFGLPGESLEAGRKAGELIRKIIKPLRARKGQIRVTINPLIPKAWTPIQYCPLLEKDAFLKRLRDFSREIKGLGVRVFTYDWRWALVQSIISLGDEKVGKAVALWGAGGGGPSKFLGILRDQEVDTNFPLKPRPPGTEMPWDVVHDSNEKLVKLIGEKLFNECVMK